jgi:nicotinate phosphoribosyltransferase
VTTPGVLGVRRYRDDSGRLAGDMVYDQSAEPEPSQVMVDPADATRRKTFSDSDSFSELLVPVFREGTCVYPRMGVEEAKARCLASVGGLDPSITRFLNPHAYPVGLEQHLNDVRTALVLEARGLGS